MNIETRWAHDIKDKDKLEGTVVVVDLCAASTNVCIILAKEPARLLVVNDDNIAKARQLYSDTILVGESETLAPTKFVSSNRPADIDRVDVHGQTVLWMSFNGSRVIEMAMRATGNGQFGEVIVGALCNASAVADYCRERNQRVVLIQAGDRGTPVYEDESGAIVIRAKLQNESVDIGSLIDKAQTVIMRDYEPEVATPKNFSLLFTLDTFPLVPSCVVNADGFYELVNR